MGYSQEVIRKAKAKLASAKADKESQYRERLQQAYAQLPRLKELDLLLRRSMVQAAQAVFTTGGDPVAAMEKVKQENLALQKERQALIDARLPKGFLEETPVCPHCGGSGYLGSTMCRCLSQLCLQEQLSELSGLTQGYERFDTFRLDYYPERPDPAYGVSPRVVMEKNLAKCQRFAQQFPNSGNLLFVGSTGLGKTFLSGCIANEVARKGVSIAYESAPRLFAKLEKNRFAPTEESRAEAEKFQNCDLLIIDDLGTEMPGSFVTAALSSLVNDRLLDGKNTVISTNLLISEIAKRYNPQIASRLEGNFDVLTFLGEDIRVLKNRGVR